MNKIITFKIPINQLPSGETLSLKVIDIYGQGKGPSCFIQSSVHGAELQGNLLILNLLDYLSTHAFSGHIRLVPIANPMAINNKLGGYTHGRFDPNTGENWNRFYQDYAKDLQNEIKNFAKSSLSKDSDTISIEYKKLLKVSLNKYKDSLFSYGPKKNSFLTMKLQELSIESDIVLDLHTAAKASRYLYAAEYLEKRCEDLRFSHNIIIPNNFAGAMDEASFTPWIYLQNAFKELSKAYEIPFESYTLELGSEEEISSNDAKNDLNHLLYYFYKKKMILSPPIDPMQTNNIKCKLKDYKSYYTNSSGLYEYITSPEQKVRKGDILVSGIQLNNYFDSNPIVCDIKAKQDCILLNHSASANLSQGDLICEVMENIYS